MAHFFEKWFNKYNDTYGSDFPFRKPPLDVKFNSSHIILRALATVLIALPLGSIVAVLTTLAIHSHYWYPFVASGQVTFVRLISFYWYITYRQHSSLLIVGVPILALSLFLLVSPKYYFWNRRADRLNQASDLASSVPASDGSVWPPPPIA